jgi:hypothetical protein
MTPQPDHLSAETLADLNAELLTPDQRTEAVRHLAGCATCRANRTALSDVSAELRAAAWRDPIPADVATRVEAALDREATAAREPTVVAVQGRRRPAWLPRLVGSVAALSVVAGVAYLGSVARDNGSEQGGGSAAESVAEPEAAAPAEDAAADQAEVAAATRDLAASGAAAPAVPDSRGAEQQGRQRFTATCGQPLAEELDRALVAATPYTYAGRDAILIVVSGPSAELVTGYVLPDCEAGAADAYVSVDVPRE